MKPDHGAKAGEGEAPREGPMAACAAGLCLFVILWMGRGWDVILSPVSYEGKKGDYYSSLVHGFLSGHVYMDKVADPGLASADPEVRKKTPTLLDASYYKGHFYLYFGVTPAALILFPYAMLTGGDLDPRVAVALCVVLGFLFSLGVWRMAVRDHFGRLGAGFQALSVIALAFATATPLLLTRAMFYELAVASGYACVMSGCFWIYRAQSGRGWPCLELAAASLSLGLAVGCRPDLVLTLPVLAAAAFLAGHPQAAGPLPPRRMVRIGAAAVLPAAAVGAGLACYNLARFGAPLDFGFNYGQNGFIASHFRLASATYLWPNLHWYYLTVPALSPYFPFVFPCRAEFGPKGYETGELIHGQFPVFVFAAFVVLSAAIASRRLRLGRLSAYVGLLGFMFLAVFAALCSLGVRADRYMVDFQAPLVLGVVLMAGAVAKRLRGGRGSKAWLLGFGGLSLASSAFNFFAALQEFDSFKDLRSRTYLAMEELGNYPSSWLGKLGILTAGPVQLKVSFPSDVTAATMEPLLSLGTPQFSDSLYVLRFPGNTIQFLGDHLRFVGPRSRTLSVTPGRIYTVTVDMGAFYPPIHDPFFSQYGDTRAQKIKSGIHVEVDGLTVMDAKMNSYDAPPWTLELGRNTISMGPGKRVFSGQIVSMKRLSPLAAAARIVNNGLWRIQCFFPSEPVGASVPILADGVTGSGTLVYLNVMSQSQFRFGVDEWSFGGGYSDALSVDPRLEHTVEIFIGPLAKRAAWPKAWEHEAERFKPAEHLLRVWLDGNLVWTTELKRSYDLATDARFEIGANTQGFSTTPPGYPAYIKPDPFYEDDAGEFLGRNLDAKP
jgi:hypothetical protein